MSYVIECQWFVNEFYLNSNDSNSVSVKSVSYAGEPKRLNLERMYRFVLPTKNVYYNYY